ncbi:BlaI/MecI/CopY family transcriptional regulator [Dactylosporangium sp. NPDC049525]|uniref:BlaI/MecI/CopY family transcriptional regulator n=1 Tax=Dactylosporangium sp. NPDC049525 TaxID=3154730 RepID=UPI0034122BD9
MSERQPRRAWGSLESDIMALLWAATEPLTPGQVQTALAQSHGDDRTVLAYNTVLTILTRMHDKGLLQRQPSGRAHAYRPTHDAATAAAAQMRAVLDGPGDRRAVLQQFADRLDASDVEVLRALLERTDGGAPG